RSSSGRLADARVAPACRGRGPCYAKDVRPLRLGFIPVAHLCDSGEKFGCVICVTPLAAITRYRNVSRLAAPAIGQGRTGRPLEGARETRALRERGVHPMTRPIRSGGN